jgi:polyisoprenoid-binding protein YceI
MKILPLLALILLSPLWLAAADRVLKIDKTRSFVDVDVKATVDSFVGRLENYDVAFDLDAAGKIKSATLGFKFTDLRTGKPDRDAKMIDWLGGGTPEAKFQAGIVAVAPDGQGQVTGSLTMHGLSRRVEFPVHVTVADGTYTIAGEANLDHRDWELKVIRMALVLKVDPVVKVKFKFTGTLPPEAKADE